MKQNLNIEAEGSELILKNKAGDYVIIPKKYRTEVQGMIKDGCHGCIDALVETLPVMADYAEDGSLYSESLTNDPPTQKSTKHPLDPNPDGSLPSYFKGSAENPILFDEVTVVAEAPQYDNDPERIAKIKRQIKQGWSKVKATLNPKNWGVPDYTDKGSRDAAYAAARRAGEKEFMWNNKRFSTSIKNENPYKTGNYKSKIIPTTYLANKTNTPQENIVRDKTEYNLHEGKLYFSRTGEVTDGNVIIGGDYMENFATALPAYNYKHLISSIKLSGKKEIPLDKENQLFYGIINNKFKTGKVSDFNDDDVIVPIRFGGRYDKSTPISEEDAKLLEINRNLIAERNSIFHSKDFTETPEYKEFLKNNPKKNLSKHGEKRRFLNYYKQQQFDNAGLGSDFEDVVRKIESDNFIFKQNGRGVYSSADDGKIILHSPKSGKQLYLFKNSRSEIMEKSQKFLEENPDAEFISLDTGRYNFMIENSEGLTQDDFIKYSSADLKRGDKLGYNIIFAPYKYHDYGDGKQKRMYYSDKELSELDPNKRNFDTLALQRELSNRGYKLPKSTKKDGSFDGIWGDETKNALLDYQTKNKKK